MNEFPVFGYSARYDVPCTRGAGSVPVDENWMNTPVDGTTLTIGETTYPDPFATGSTSTTTDVNSNENVANVVGAGLMVMVGFEYPDPQFVIVID